MSGHSHYATIKRQKESKDAAKGKVFSKHAKAIQVAIKTGGSADPDSNAKLRFAIEQAKADNTPRSNIERILSKANEVGDFYEVVYEGYGPSGIGVVVNAATDNKNRTAQEIKNIFERGGGSLAGPGSVSFNFELKGSIIVKKEADFETQMLNIIDLGADDIDEQGDVLEIYTSPALVSEIKNKLESSGFVVQRMGLIMKPKNYVEVSDQKAAEKAIKFLDTLEDNDDVQNVYTNLDIPQDTLDSIKD